MPPKFLMVVESPNKVETLKEILGPDWTVTASFGHIRDLPQKSLGIGQGDFSLEYVYIPATQRDGRNFSGGKERIDRITAKMNGIDMVYLAPDPDREGEAIAWHLKECLGLNETSYKRITFDSLTPSVITASIQQARKIDYNLVRAQEARRALDRIVGYIVSPLLSNTVGIPLSAGRVQSPAVRLVVDRENSIKNFTKTIHYGAVVFFDNNAWHAEWNTKPFIKDVESPYILDEELAKRAASCRQFQTTHSESKVTQESPPPPFSTSLLLQAASVTLKFNPELTTKLAQSLYEQGLVTYIRTDNVNFSEDAIKDLRNFAKEKGWKLPNAPRRFKSKGDAQEAHEAIRPTHFETETAGETDQERALYNLIWQRSIASQLEAAKYKVNAVTMTSRIGEETFEFKATGRILIDPGWRVLTSKDAVEDETDEKEAPSGKVPILIIGSEKLAEKGELLKKETRPPSRYTEASLIAKLEAEGLGRPSTYAAIMKNIKTKRYIIEEKRLFKPTETGYLLVELLVKSQFSFIHLPFTRNLESKLDQIATGNSQYIEVVQQAHHQLQSEIAAANEAGGFTPRFPCPKCNSPLRRYAKKVEGRPTGEFGWHCTNKEAECKTFLDDRNGNPVEQTTHICPKCKSAPLRRYSKKVDGQPTGEFGWHCTNKEAECKTFLDDRNGNPVALTTYACPKCKNSLVRHKGQDGFWWGCSNYKNGCKVNLKDKNGKPYREAKTK